VPIMRYIPLDIMCSWWFLAENGGDIFAWHIRCLSPGYTVFYFRLIYDLVYQPVLQLSMYMLLWCMIITRSNMPVILTPIIVGHCHELSRAVWWYLSIFIFKICRLHATLLCKIGIQNYWIIETIIIRDMTASDLVKFPDVSEECTTYFHLLGQSVSWVSKQQSTLLLVYTAAHPKDGNLYSLCHEIFKSCLWKYTWSVQKETELVK
jgi:hypothetical protein